MTFEEPCCHSRAIMNTDMTKDRWVGSEARAPPWILISNAGSADWSAARGLGRSSLGLVYLNSMRKADGSASGWSAKERRAKRIVLWAFGGWYYFCFVSELLWICFFLLIVLKIARQLLYLKIKKKRVVVFCGVDDLRLHIQCAHGTEL